MSTGLEKKNLYDKVLLNKESLDTYLLRYLESVVKAVLRGGYPLSVTLDGGLLTSDTANTLDISAFEGVDGLGNRISVAAQNNLPFANVSPNNYHVGYHYVEIPQNTEINQATSAIAFSRYRDEVGEVAAPTQVFDDGDGSLTIVVDSMYEASENHGGRLARVWLTSPLSLDSWSEDLTVSYGVHPTHFPATPKNYISTAGLLGQSGTPSTTASVYRVWAKGPTIRRDSAGIDSDRVNYAYLGRVVGNSGTPTNFLSGRVRPMDFVTGTLQGPALAGPGIAEQLRALRVYEASSSPALTLDGTEQEVISVTITAGTIGTQVEDIKTAHVVHGSLWVLAGGAGSLYSVKALDGFGGAIGLPMEQNVSNGENAILHIGPWVKYGVVSGSPPKIRLMITRLAGSGGTVQGATLVVTSLAKAKLT